MISLIFESVDKYFYLRHLPSQEELLLHLIIYESVLIPRHLKKKTTRNSRNKKNSSSWLNSQDKICPLEWTVRWNLSNTRISGTLQYLAMSTDLDISAVNFKYSHHHNDTVSLEHKTPIISLGYEHTNQQSIHSWILMYLSKIWNSEKEKFLNKNFMKRLSVLHHADR